MADLIVNEKYPPGRRIDHQDFGDVSKTTFAKGVISDFQVDDPDDMVGTIKSQVKVTGDWGESDFIPIFYHPKKQYWDDDPANPTPGHTIPVLATDFNEEGYFFERAWMSFRGDDEVAVMLREGTPVVAIAFVDGVPRPGENWVKAECPPFTLGADPVKIYQQLIGVFGMDASEKGPDGLDIGFKKESEYADGGGASHSTPASYYARNIIYSFEANYWYSPGVTKNFKLRVYVVVVGPFVFAVYLILRSTVDPGGGGPYSLWWYQDACWELQVELSEWEYRETHGGSLSEPPPCMGTTIPGFTYSLPSDRKYGCVAYTNKIGLYSKELYDQILSNIPNIVVDESGNPSIGGSFPEGLHDTTINLAGLISTDNTESWNVDEVKFTTRPHTKEELEAAGMWLKD